MEHISGNKMEPTDMTRFWVSSLNMLCQTFPAATFLLLLVCGSFCRQFYVRWLKLLYWGPGVRLYIIIRRDMVAHLSTLFTLSIRWLLFQCQQKLWETVFTQHKHTSHTHMWLLQWETFHLERSRSWQDSTPLKRYSIGNYFHIQTLRLQWKHETYIKVSIHTKTHTCTPQYYKLFN